MEQKGITCLIIAAGMGTRLADRTECKPMPPIAGLPLINHVLSGMKNAGIYDFIIVTGYNRDKIESHLQQQTIDTSLRIRFVHNEEWRRANGLSVYAARKILRSPFILAMADHLFDPFIVKSLLGGNLAAGTSKLAIDRPHTADWIDIEDVTKVLETDGRIIDIGKSLSNWNAYDTGIFFCSPNLFDALEESIHLGDDSLSGGIRVLAKKEAAHVCDISGYFWLDVDDNLAVSKAERMLHRIKPLIPEGGDGYGQIF